MAKLSNKKMKGLLKSKKETPKKEVRAKGEGGRDVKHKHIEKISGNKKPARDWEGQVSKNLDKLVNEIKKGYNIDEDTTGELTTNVLKRVKLYQEVAELTGIPLTVGEAIWAIQYEYTYQRQLFKQDTTKEESLRDVNVHNLKYIIEQLYNRRGNPDMETLKQRIYDTTDVEKIPTTDDKAVLEGVYTQLLEESVNAIREELKSK